MKILIADDHALFREGLRHVLLQFGAGVTVIEAPNCEQALSLSALNPDLDLALLDLKMPGMDGFEAMSLLLERSPALPIVVLSSSEDPADMRRALEAGAMGFISKSETAQVILSALRLVLSGGIYVPPALVRESAIRAQSHASAASSRLTPRQLGVLSLVVQGKSNKMIARELDLSEATVKVHVSAIMKALNAVNRTQVAMTAKKLGLIKAT
ncbi:MAG TPA: response regulator transcription factor [Burkholderiales bacterium]|nr:response regulator transcription factor [Burkholderiales bacterium]